MLIAVRVPSAHGMRTSARHVCEIHFVMNPHGGGRREGPEGALNPLCGYNALIFKQSYVFIQMEYRHEIRMVHRRLQDPRNA